jgi:hypothetical protein
MSKKTKTKKVRSPEDKKQQHKYQLIVAGICVSIMTIITLLVYLIYHI